MASALIFLKHRRFFVLHYENAFLKRTTNIREKLRAKKKLKNLKCGCDQCAKNKLSAWNSQRSRTLRLLGNVLQKFLFGGISTKWYNFAN